MQADAEGNGSYVQLRTSNAAIAQWPVLSMQSLLLDQRPGATRRINTSCVDGAVTLASKAWLPRPPIAA